MIPTNQYDDGGKKFNDFLTCDLMGSGGSEMASMMYYKEDSAQGLHSLKPPQNLNYDVMH